MGIDLPDSSNQQFGFVKKITKIRLLLTVHNILFNVNMKIENNFFQNYLISAANATGIYLFKINGRNVGTSS